VPHTHGTLRRSRHRRDRDRRRAHILPRPRPRPDRGAPIAMTTQTQEHQHAPGDSARDRHPLPKKSMFDPKIVRTAVGDSFKKLHPRTQMRNPVMFVVLVGSLLSTFLFLRDSRTTTAQVNVFVGVVALFLWFTVLFATFAEAMAEGRG